MALYIQLSTQNVFTKFLSVSSITGGNSVNSPQLVSTVAGLLISPVVPLNFSTQNITASTIYASSITATNVTSAVFSSLAVYTSSLVGVATGGLATIPSSLSTFAIFTSSLQVSTLSGNFLSTQQLNFSTAKGVTTDTFQLYASSALISSLSTNNLNFAGGFGYLVMPDIYPNTVYTSTVTTSNVLVGVNSVVSPIQFYGFGSYSNTVIAELSTGATTQELLFFRGSNATDRMRFQTTGSMVFEPGVSARIWPTVPSNVTPAMIINTSSNIGIQTASPSFPLDVAGTGRFQLVSSLGLWVSSINGSVYGTFLGSTTYLNVSSTATISSLTVNSLQFGDGTGWVNLGPLQTVALSSIQTNTNALYANTEYLGTVSTVNALQFYGLFGAYNNTAIAEVSTGVGTQELLMFKGSSTSDRVRIQTTGNFVVETGVTGRLWASNSLSTLSNVTPAFIVNTSSNVGIQTATPGATLDVAGTGRFLTMSSQNLYVSSLFTATRQATPMFITF